MQFSLFFNSCTIFMMPSELRFKKITGSWNHGGKSTRYRAWQEGFLSWNRGRLVRLSSAALSILQNKPMPDGLSALGYLLPAPQTKQPGSFGKPSAEHFFSPYLTPDFRDVTSPAFTSPLQVPRASSRSIRQSLLGAGVCSSEQILPRIPAFAPRAGWGSARTQRQPFPGRPALLPRSQQHRRRALHAVNRTKFAIKSMKFYLATLGKHLWHT